MPRTEVYIHFVWTTKNRYPFLFDKDLRNKMWYHIKENAQKKNILVDHVNGHNDHVHCLLALDHNMSMAKAMQLIKGESAHWFNNQKFINKELKWQKEYYAVSVSRSEIERVRNYIRGQEERHINKDFDYEAEAFLKIYGFKKYEDYE